MPSGWDNYQVMCKPSFYNQRWNINGKNVTTGSAPADYTTSVMGNASVAWIKALLANPDHPPFFAAVGPHAPHLPSTPAPWYAGTLGALRAPTTGNYGYHGVDHHWEISMQPPIDEGMAASIDAEFTKRQESLLSVDDLMKAVHATLAAAGEWENTYAIFTSDHGYSLGQFRVPTHKTQVMMHVLTRLCPLHLLLTGIRRRRSTTTWLACPC